MTLLDELERKTNDEDYTPDIYDYERVWPVLPKLIAFVRAYDEYVAGKRPAGYVEAAREALNEPGE